MTIPIDEAVLDDAQAMEQADPGQMLQRVQTPLMALLRQSPEFRPACEPLVAMAGALRAREPSRAQAIVAELDAVGARCVATAATAGTPNTRTPTH